MAGTRALELFNQPLLLQQLYDLLQDAQAFVLFCTDAQLLWMTTESLLRDGRDLSVETRKPYLITNYGCLAILCVCDEGGSGRKGTPCALGVSLKE